MRAYKNCYVAFLDILGFKNLIMNSGATCEMIAKIFDELKQPKFLTIEEKGQPKRDFVPREAVHFKVMSDSVIIFIDADVEYALLGLVITCIDFQMRVLNLETFTLIRGGITKGDIYSDGETIFGTGLVNAHRGESKISKNISSTGNSR